MIKIPAYSKIFELMWRVFINQSGLSNSLSSNNTTVISHCELVCLLNYKTLRFKNMFLYQLNGITFPGKLVLLYLACSYITIFIKEHYFHISQPCRDRGISHFRESIQESRELLHLSRDFYPINDQYAIHK